MDRKFIQDPKFTEKTNSREKAQKAQKKTKDGIAARDRKDRKKNGSEKSSGVKLRRLREGWFIGSTGLSSGLGSGGKLFARSGRLRIRSGCGDRAVLCGRR